MRKLTFLKEDQIYLQQVITQTVDEVEKEINGKVEALGAKIEATIPTGMDNLHLSPEMITFKHEENVIEKLDLLKDKIASSATGVYNLGELTLAQSAKLSLLVDKLTYTEGKTYASDVEKLLSFFGVDNADIPESAENNFKVVVSEEGKNLALKTFGSLQDIAFMVKEGMLKFLSKGGEKEEFKSLFLKMMILDEISGIIIPDNTREEVEEVSAINEEVLNEGFFQWVGMKIISWSIGILPEKELNKLWDKTLSKLKPEERKKVEDAKPSKKDKVNILRTAIRKEYETNNSFKKKVEEASKKIKEAAKEEKAKEKDLKEEWTGWSTLNFITLVANILAFMILPVISNTALLLALWSALGLGLSLQKDFLK